MTEGERETVTADYNDLVVLYQNLERKLELAKDGLNYYANPTNHKKFIIALSEKGPPINSSKIEKDNGRMAKAALEVIK